MHAKTIKIIKLVLGALLGILGISIFLMSAFLIFQFRVAYAVISTLQILLVVFFLFFFSSLLLQSVVISQTQKHKIRKAGLSCMFLYYLLILFQLLFASRSYLLHFNFQGGIIKRLIRNGNLVPFHTIFSYLKNQNHYSMRIVLTNIVGNVIAFMPFAFFLQALYKKAQHFLFFFAFMLCDVFLVELIQGFTGLGTFDVDDIILNVGGACLFFAIFRLPILQSFIRWYHV